MPAPRDLLRFLTCGSVDDGKSTLIGRLLYDTELLAEDERAALARDSSGGIDFSRLLDGLEAERQQGITIDVAYRFFATQGRRFIVADCPGHEQYTRNMVTGASTADLAVVLVDARKGLLAQTRRHTLIAALLGIRHIVLAVNKMDLVGFDAARFAAIVADYRALVSAYRFVTAVEIPLCARDGDNVISISVRMPWYSGPSLLAHLEQVEIDPAATNRPLRLPVQYVIRGENASRYYAGTIAAGVVRPGDAITIARSGQVARVQRIVTLDGDLPEAGTGQAVAVTFDAERDLSRGDVLCAPPAVSVADQFSAHLVWLAETPLLPGRAYLLKLATQTVAATVTRIRHRIDISSGQRLAAETLAMNEIGVVQISTATPIAFAPYPENRDLGGAILIDRQSNATAGAVMLDFALRRASNIAWQHLDVNAAARARLKGQRAAVVWFTGLSGAGKSTIANLVERRLHAEGRHTYILDGDNVRHGLNRDLGFTEADRVENIRRAAEVAALMADAGLIVLVSFIAPYRADRDLARERVGRVPFLEAYVDASVKTCRARDVKGLYRRADAGEIRNFTGVSAPYEPPLAPELHLQTEQEAPETLAGRVVEALRARGCLAAPEAELP